MKRHQVRRIVKTVIACSLAAVMGFMNPAQSLAAGGSGKEYISEVRLSTANTEANAKKWLEDNGYTVMLDSNKGKAKCQNLNAGTGENPVLLGYKTTKDPDEAITDMAVMDMDGGYSFSDYETMLKKQKEGVREMVKAIQAALTEYRSNYKAGTPGAKKAYELMNQLKEDDSGKLMGDFLLDESLAEDELVKVIMQGNSIAMISVYQGLALACSESDTDNWLKRLSDIGPDDSLSTKYDSKAREIYNDLWDNLRKQLLFYVESGLTPDASEADVEAWKEENGENAYSTWLHNMSTYMQLDSYSYGDGTLAEFFSRDKDEIEEEMGMEAFYPIAAAMTEGQRSVSRLVGLEYMIQVAVTSKKSLEKADKEAEKSVDEMLEENEEVKVPELVSIYAGVDRSLFDGGVALTSEALQKTAATGDTSWWHGNISIGAEIALASVAVSFTVLGVSLIIIQKAMNIAFEKVWAYEKTWLDYKFRDMLSDFLFEHLTNFNPQSIIYFVGSIALAAALIAAGIYIGLELYNYYHPDFTEIPRILVDERKDEDGKTTYVNYYAVKDQKGELADMNAWKGKKWNALYTSKDKNAGNPITTDIFCLTGKNAAEGQFSPVHKFGQKAAFNLNKHCYDDDVNGIYFFFAGDEDAYNYIASSFGMGQMAMTAGIGALGGILIGVFSTTMAGKRKGKKKSVAA